MKTVGPITEESDEQNEYTSSVWGDGTTKVVAHHYKTVQGRKKAEDGKKATVNNFLDIGNKLAETRKEKAVAKKCGL